MIGLFVLGAAALMVAALAAFGSGMLFTKQYQCIMFFDSSVTGLDLGSPVLFRGVPIGAVKDIRIEANPEKLKFSIPVVVEITGGKLKLGGNAKNSKEQTLMSATNKSPEELIKTLAEHGLRAQLVTQSFVTGQLAIALDLRPDTPIKLHGDENLPEIPTIPSEFEEFTQTLKTLPLKELVSRLIGAVSGIENLVNSPQSAQIPGKIDTTLTNANQLMVDMRTRIDTLAKNLDQAVQSYSDLAGNLDQRTEKLSGNARKSLEMLDSTLAEGKSALAKFQKVVNPESASVTELNKAMAEIAQAAKSIRALADYLERHPEALIQGKGSNRR
jgi:paraquat-inducible protein B